jgi:hypothetical protein
VAQHVFDAASDTSFAESVAQSVKAFAERARLAAQCREIRFRVADVLCDVLP